MSSSVRYSFFTAMRKVTARNPMIAIRIVHALDLSSSQSDDFFQSERSRVSFELQCCQDEDVQVIGWCHDQDDVCQLA